MPLPAFKPSMKPPTYIPYSIGQIQQDALNYDTLAFKRSDNDFATRHPGMLAAEQMTEDRIKKDQTGNSTLMPQVQSEFQRAGIGNSLEAFGDSGPTLAMGGAGEANVARNLGMNIMGFQQMNRGNANDSMQLGENIFQRRTFGLTGQNAAMIDMLNNAGQNNMNQTNYANQMQVDQMNQRIQQENMSNGIAQGNSDAAASASKRNAMIGAGAAIAMGLLMAF